METPEAPNANVDRHWRHQMEIFSALLALCEGNSPVTVGFPSQRPMTQIFHIFIDLHLNKWLSKQSRRWWFETPLCSLRRHCKTLAKIFQSAEVNCDLVYTKNANTFFWWCKVQNTKQRLADSKYFGYSCSPILFPLIKSYFMQTNELSWLTEFDT